MVMDNAVFEDNAHAWWDVEGVFKPLHMLNPKRMEFIVEHIQAHTQRDSLKGLHILDVGCGGGLICEPLSRLGAHVTGIDLSQKTIDVATSHALDHNLTIDYRVAPLETLTETFDVIIASEVIEHVKDQAAFVKSIADRLKPGGCFVITTLNRTLKSKILGIWAAEYLLKWAPIGAHTHDLFVRPSELSHMCDRAGLKLTHLSGLTFNPLTWEFSLGKDMDINYFAFGVK